MYKANIIKGSLVTNISCTSTDIYVRASVRMCVVVVIYMFYFESNDCFPLDPGISYIVHYKIL